MNESLKRKHLGIVEDIDDPLKEGRARIRVPFLHKDIPTEHLPWAKQISAIYFGKDGQGANISIPRINSLVEVTFNNDDRYSPEYSIVHELSSDLKEFLKQTEYENAHIFLYDGDEDLKIYYTGKDGFVISLKESTFTIFNDNRIELRHKDDKSIIELDGGTIRKTADSSVDTTAGSRIKNTSKEIWDNGDLVKLGTTPQYSVVLGEPLFLLLQTLATIIDAKYSPTPSVATTAVNEFKSLVLSKTVKSTN